ncbi:MAG: lysophospholipid acyltransferase family protein [Acidobacteria bacterium]|nr:lysophospholipid acyltransferase family protein [Acidobacteriota bacterium]
MLPLRELNEIYRMACGRSGEWFGSGVLNEMDIRYRVEATDIGKIPRQGPVVVVANHPFGMVDGLIAATVMLKVRPDVKMIANYLLGGVERMKEVCLYVDPFGSSPRNHIALKEALGWLKRGGALISFPSGEVSCFHARSGRVEDPRWTDTAARLIRMTNAAALPFYFRGRNSMAFQALGLVHPALRTARLAYEFLDMRGRVIDLRVGTPIAAAAMAGMSTSVATEYLRRRTYVLGSQSVPARNLAVVAGRPRPVAAEIGRARLAENVAQLRSHHLYAEDRDLSAFLAPAEEIPEVLAEIGRLREVTFRAAGEGTGEPADIDHFDSYYRHLFVWNRAKEEVVGAYRIGDIGEILGKLGIAGLYTSTLFAYDPRLFACIGAGYELGRSFVRQEYQRQYAPLLLLWKAIGRLVSDCPDHAVLFGAVSISREYSRASRELLVHYCGSHLRSHLAGLVKPRRPFRPRQLREWEVRQLTSLLDPGALAATIWDVEKNARDIPILLKHYMKLGGEILGFNLDKEFSSVVDGLVLVDLRKTNPAMLARYMGKDGAAAFLAHGTATRQPASCA